MVYLHLTARINNAMLQMQRGPHLNLSKGQEGRVLLDGLADQLGTCRLRQSKGCSAPLLLLLHVYSLNGSHLASVLHLSLRADDGALLVLLRLLHLRSSNRCECSHQPAFLLVSSRPQPINTWCSLDASSRPAA